MSNVRAIRGASAPGEPVPCVVETLELLLEQAKSGHLTALAYATVTTGMVSATGWDKASGGGGVETSEGHVLASGILTLMHRFASAASA